MSVYGIPGFETSDNAEEFAFTRLTEDEAIEISEIWFDVSAESAVRLDTERDDSFRLQTRNGERVLKVAHPADTDADIDLQVRALQHAAKADRSLPLQRVIATPGGAPWVRLPSGRIARMLDWLPGELLLNATTGPRELAALGEALGRLSAAMFDFTNDAASHLSAWDLQTVPRLATLLAEAPDDSVAEAIARFTTRVVPHVDELPVQVIHNDFNPGNVLIDPQAPEFVVGILDFGDIVPSFRVADLAVGLSYQLFPLQHSWTDVAPMIEAFEQRVALTGIERAVLPDLVAARFAQRILINGWLAERENESYDERDEVIATLVAVLNLEA